MKKYRNLALILATTAITHIAFAPPVSMHIAETYNIYVRRVINKTPQEIHWYVKPPAGMMAKIRPNKVRGYGEEAVDKKINRMPYTINVSNEKDETRLIGFDLKRPREGTYRILQITIANIDGTVLDTSNVRLNQDFIYNASIIIEGDMLENTRVTVMGMEQTKPLH